MQLLPPKTSLAIASFSLLVLLLATADLVQPVDFAAVVDFHPRTSPTPMDPVRRLKPAVRTAKDKAVEVDAIVPPAHLTTPAPTELPDRFSQLVEPPGSLNSFYRALSSTKGKQSVTRILHYGDSPVTADLITADLRSLLQRQFGDAGHGFILIAKPWAWYGHRGVEVRASGWRIEPASQSRARDGMHGLGGVNFRGEPGAWTRIHLESPHNRLEVAFLRQPGGGTLKISAGEQPIGEVPTDGPGKRSDWATLSLPPATQDVSLGVVSGAVRVFGVSFTKDAPGLIYNSLGLNGGQVQVVVRYFDQDQWAVQLHHERPDLVVINYGTNESIFPSYINTYYRRELRQVIERVKAAVPNSSILVMSPMDRGQRDSSGQIATVPILPRIVDMQREAAGETGCAFFNTFEAMGGAGTMAEWYAMQPRLVSADFTHPLPGGARKIAVLLDEALLRGYQRFEAKQ
ncbi:MAG: GDSL-type esterase/lipase family protein [Acidobacteriota bacterium]|nr:GDSL-type esterase/lipase family protein [Acidobacteriota bacterium]